MTKRQNIIPWTREDAGRNEVDFCFTTTFYFGFLHFNANIWTFCPPNITCLISTTDIKDKAGDWNEEKRRVSASYLQRTCCTLPGLSIFSVFSRSRRLTDPNVGIWRPQNETQQSAISVVCLRTALINPTDATFKFNNLTLYDVMFS